MHWTSVVILCFSFDSGKIHHSVPCFFTPLMNRLLERLKRSRMCARVCIWKREGRAVLFWIPFMCEGWGPFETQNRSEDGTTGSRATVYMKRWGSWTDLSHVTPRTLLLTRMSYVGVSPVQWHYLYYLAWNWTLPLCPLESLKIPEVEIPALSVWFVNGLFHNLSYITRVHNWSLLEICFGLLFNGVHTVITFVCTCLSYFLTYLAGSIYQNINRLVA